jgi:integrase/recombinase XerC
MRPLEEICKDFLKDLETRGYALNSTKTYEITLKQMLAVSEYYEEGDGVVLDITPYRLTIVKQSKKTITKKLSAIRSLVKYMKEQCLMKVTLLADETIKVPQSLPRPVEEHYIEEVLEKATLEQRLLVSMLYGLGLRISELSSLEIENIQPQWVKVVGKGNKEREIPLLPELFRLIQEYLSCHACKKYLFEKGGVPLNDAQLRYKLTTLFKKEGLKVTPHQLRHSFATHLLNNGARIADVSELLGHETMATTQIYTKLGSTKKQQEYMKAHPLAQNNVEK